MNKSREFFLACIIAVLLTGIFFYKTILHGLVPFPADVLVNEYQPWRSTSYLGFVPGTIPHKAQYPDTVRQIYPWKTLSIDLLKHGKLPLWNPYNFSGTPLLANFQSAIFYPLNSLYAITSQIDGWSILVALQPILATFFMYVFARSIGIGSLGSTLTAISYGFSGFMIVWLEYNTVGHVILWLPLILLAVEKLKKQSSTFWTVVLSLAHASALFAGHPQVYGYLFAFSLFYIATRVQALHRKTYLILVSCLGVGISCIQLIPGIELISHAARSPHDFQQFFHGILIQPWQFISLFFPNFFGNPATRTYWLNDTFLGKVTTIGLVPLFFLPGIFRRKEPIVRWFMWATIAIVVLISANPLSFILYRLPLPIISSSSPTLMSFLFAFCLSILCGFGLDHWITEKHSIRKLIIRTVQVMGLFIFLVVLTYLPILHPHSSVIKRAILYGGMISTATLGFFWIAILKPKMLKGAVVAMLIIGVVDQFIFFQRFNAFIPKSLVFPNHEITTFIKDHADLRYWGYGTAAIPANLATQFGGLSPEGYDPLYPKWYGQFIYAYIHGKILTSFSNATRSDAAIVSGFGPDGLSDDRKNRILAATSVGYILDRTENGSTQGTFPDTSFTTVYGKGDWHIFKSKTAAPHAYLANVVRTYANENDFSSQFFSPSYDPSQSVLVMNVPKNVPIQSQPGTISITSYEPNQVTIHTQSAETKILVLTDTYYPGWVATIDGHSTEIFKANWTYRGVVVPKGAHKIIFQYQPLSVRIGFYLSMISIGVLFLIITTHPKHRS